MIKVAASLAVGLLVVAGSASRAEAGTYCASVSALANAPQGALVNKRSGGGSPIQRVIDSGGEYLTHSVLSNGIDATGKQLFTHDSTTTPGQRQSLSACTAGPLDVSQLSKGTIGVEVVGAGAMYQAIYGSDGVTEHASFQRPASAALGAAVMSPALDKVSMPWITKTSSYDSTQTFGSLRFSSAYSSNIGYELYQFRDIGNAHLGNAVGLKFGGFVCSTYLASMHARGGAGIIYPASYDNATTVAALDGLKLSVETDCKNKTGWFIGVGDVVCNACEDAGQQVRNCMALGKCDSDDTSAWNTAKVTATTRSVSPDRLAGRGTKHYADTTNGSMWKAAVAEDLQWNQPGSNYSCYK
jgi:hypothetical protein